MIPNASSLASIVKYATDGDAIIPFPPGIDKSTENVSFPSGIASSTIVKTQEPEFWFGLNSTTCERLSTSFTAESFIWNDNQKFTCNHCFAEMVGCEIWRCRCLLSIQGVSTMASGLNNWFIHQRALIKIWSTWEVWRARKMRKSCYTSFLGTLQTSQVLHISMNTQLTYEPIVL